VRFDRRQAWTEHEKRVIAGQHVVQCTKAGYDEFNRRTTCGGWDRRRKGPAASVRQGSAFRRHRSTARADKAVGATSAPARTERGIQPLEPLVVRDLTRERTACRRRLD